MLVHVLFLFLLEISCLTGEREFKVHNIILYPEKHSWCQTTPIQQVVASPGYEAVTIDNNICVGACYSYSIPSTQPAEPGELLGPYCDSCQPTVTKCYHVTLQADNNNIDGAKTFKKRVQIIFECSCTACGKLQTPEDCEVSSESTLELPHDLFSNHSQELRRTKVEEEIPELLHFKPSQNRSSSRNNTTTAYKYELNPKLLKLLENIQNGGDDYTVKELRELLKIIEGTDQELNDRNLLEFVNYVNTYNTEDLELDLGKLKDILANLQKKQHILEKHRDFGLGLGQTNNLQIEDDLKKYNLPANYGLEQSEVGPLHQLGDEVHAGLSVGHLVRGPHGSMVLAPTLKVEEKLNIDSDVLKPNHDGVVISYENHGKPKVNDILTN